MLVVDSPNFKGRHLNRDKLERALEWQEGHIEGAEQVYVEHLKEEADGLSRDKPIATTCGWGGRGGLGASILKKMGFSDIYNVLGGIKAWKSRGYPSKKKAKEN